MLLHKKILVPKFSNT